MQRYKVWVRVINEQGTKHPRPQRVSWGAERVADPAGALGGEHESDYSYVSDESGVQAGYYTCIKDAESRGEPITVDDIALEVEQVTEILERGKLVNARRNKNDLSGHYKKIFDEIMKRPRPLA